MWSADSLTDSKCYEHLSPLVSDLAQHRYFDDADFIKYLEYLRYWEELPYCSYLVFPHCLRMLELLQQPSFRLALKRADYKDFIFEQQHWHWKYRQCALPHEVLKESSNVQWHPSSSLVLAAQSRIFCVSLIAVDVRLLRRGKYRIQAARWFASSPCSILLMF